MVEAFSVSGKVGADAVEIRLSRGLRTWPVRDASGAVVAAAHGFLIDGWMGAGLSVVDGEIHTDATIITPADFEKRVMFGLCGLLLFETCGGGLGRRLYPDCGGTIPVVYCADNRRFGPSASHVLDGTEYEQRLLRERVDKFVNNEGHGGWISGTLTAHEGVARLLSNHYLDLDTFTAHRFWPGEDLLSGARPPLAETAASVARDLTGFVEAVARQHRTVIALTAGLDSRLVFGAARNVADKIGAYTFSAGIEGYDQVIPRNMCAAFGVHHEELPLIYATPAQGELWDREVGHAARSSNRGIYPTMASVHGEMALTGLYGEPARCFLYGHDWQTIDRAPATPANILARLKQPPDAGMEENVGAWLASIAHLPRSTVLDLAYLELRMCSWAMAQAPIQRVSLWMLMPFAQWSIQSLFLTLPVEVRAGQSVLRNIGEHLWPEAMEWPINAYGDWRDRLGPLNKLMRSGGIKTVQRYLRKRMAQ